MCNLLPRPNRNAPRIPRKSRPHFLAERKNRVVGFFQLPGKTNHLTGAAVYYIIYFMFHMFETERSPP